MERKSALPAHTKAMILAAVVLPAIAAGGLRFFAPRREAAVTARAPSAVSAVPRDTAVPPPSAATSKKIRVLIVPGHEPDSGGTSFRGLKERDLSVRLGQDLRDALQADDRYEVIMTRDAAGWNPVFSEYFKKERDAIIAWRDAAKRTMSARIASGMTSRPAGAVDHNAAGETVSVELYGINKWAGENGIDITIHVHFNDYRDFPSRVPGKYSGFSIYVPSPAYGNADATRAVAEKVFDRLAAYDPVSDLPGESTGIIDEPHLIAVGEDDTAKAASMLIEYGYIYERRFTDPAIRDRVLKDLAYQTYVGLRSAAGLGDAAGPSGPFGTLFLPHAWSRPMTRTAADPVDVFALQSALARDGDRPSAAKFAYRCPRTGSFDACTRVALAAFQAKYGIRGEDGRAGPATIEKLNGLFSGSSPSK